MPFNQHNATKFIELYSSINFTNSADSKTINNVKFDDVVKLKIKFVSVYLNLYFKSIVTLDILINNGNPLKINTVIKDIAFKNNLNVSASSQTQDYKYLYDISSSSADNKSSCDGSHSDISIQSILDKNLEKEIATNIKSFIESNAFALSYDKHDLTITLDTLNFPGSETFPTFSSVKNIIKYKKKHDCHSMSSLSSSSSSSSRSDKIPQYITSLIIIAIILFIIMYFKNLNIMPGFTKKINNFFDTKNNYVESMDVSNSKLMPEDMSEDMPKSMPE